MTSTLTSTKTDTPLGKPVSQPSPIPRAGRGPTADGDRAGSWIVLGAIAWASSLSPPMRSSSRPTSSSWPGRG